MLSSLKAWFVGGVPHQAEGQKSLAPSRTEPSLSGVANFSAVKAVADDESDAQALRMVLPSRDRCLSDLDGLIEAVGQIRDIVESSYDEMTQEERLEVVRGIRTVAVGMGLSPSPASPSRE